MIFGITFVISNGVVNTSNKGQGLSSLPTIVWRNSQAGWFRALRVTQDHIEVRRLGVSEKKDYYETGKPVKAGVGRDGLAAIVGSGGESINPHSIRRLTFHCCHRQNKER